MSNPIDEDFVQYCRQASDSQLRVILLKEWNADGHRDYGSARLAAAERGWRVAAGRVV